MPAGSAGQFTFAGTGSFDGFNLSITGNRVVTMSAVLRRASVSVVGATPRFVLSGQASGTYVIEVSTNLVQWQNLQTISTAATGHYTLLPGNPATSMPYRTVPQERLTAARMCRGFRKPRRHTDGWPAKHAKGRKIRIPFSCG